MITFSIFNYVNKKNTRKWFERFNVYMLDRNFGIIFFNEMITPFLKAF